MANTDRQTEEPVNTIYDAEKTDMYRYFSYSGLRGKEGQQDRVRDGCEVSN